MFKQLQPAVPLTTAAATTHTGSCMCPSRWYVLLVEHVEYRVGKHLGGRILRYLLADGDGFLVARDKFGARARDRVIRHKEGGCNEEVVR